MYNLHNNCDPTIFYTILSIYFIKQNYCKLNYIQTTIKHYVINKIEIKK